MSSLRIWHNYSVGEWSIVGQWSNVVCYHLRFTIHGLLTSSMRPSEGQAQFSHSHNRRHFDRQRRKCKCTNSSRRSSSPGWYTCATLPPLSSRFASSIRITPCTAPNNDFRRRAHKRPIIATRDSLSTREVCHVVSEFVGA